MAFEFDLSKSRANWEKHGIDFVRAQELWKDPERIQIPARTGTESRFLIVGKLDDKHWSAVVTYRESVVRIISVRRAWTKEVREYEGKRFR